MSTKKDKKKKETPLKIKGSLSEVLKIAVKDNPKPKKKTK
jgi:hypothetical protein